MTEIERGNVKNTALRMVDTFWGKRLRLIELSYFASVKNCIWLNHNIRLRKWGTYYYYDIEKKNLSGTLSMPTVFLYSDLIKFCSSLLIAKNRLIYRYVEWVKIINFDASKLSECRWISRCYTHCQWTGSWKK